MKRSSRTTWFLTLIFALALTVPVKAQQTAYDRVGDHYPKNEGINILNYAFDIHLTDHSEMIQVVATIDARYEVGGQRELRLDLVKQSDILEGKGMIVDRVSWHGEDLTFRHEENQLFIALGREIGEQERIQVSVHYHGVPATGLVIGPTKKYGDFSFFSDNWSSKARNWLASVDHPYDKAANEFIVRMVKQSDILEGKGMIVDRVSWHGEDLTFRHEENQLFIALGREIGEQERIQVSVHYHGVPATGLVIGPTKKYGDFSFFSDNWSSKARNWLASVDHPYDKAANEFIVTAPARLQVVSNGLLIEETVLETGDRRTHWKNSVPIATWLYALAAAEFAVQFVDTFDGKSIQTWVYRQDRDAGFYDFAIPTKQTLAFFSDLIGPFSYEKLANIQSNSVGGGMEAASSIFYGDRSVTGTRERRWQHVIVHEIAHQWFGNAVTEYDWNHVWLSEGFATYYTLLFREYAYGTDDFKNGLKDARNRVINYYKEDYDFQVIREHLEDLDRISGPMMYQKGAWTLHMLREMIGVDTYNKGVRTYYAEFRDGTAHTGDFRRHMEEASGVDLRGFFRQWLFQGGLPTLEGTWTVDNGAFTIEISQTQETYGFDIAVDFDVKFADGSSERISLDVGYGQNTVSTKSFDKDVADVVVDPDTRLLAQWTFGRK